jgi:hypothetical protein
MTTSPLVYHRLYPLSILPGEVQKAALEDIYELLGHLVSEKIEELEKEP